MEYSLNIALIEPEIPQNTGNIARTCAATGAKLHLVGPMGFTITDKQVKRAGLDYMDLVSINYYDSFEELIEDKDINKFYFFTTKAKKNHTEATYEDESYIVFGKETKGLSQEILSLNPNNNVRIPMLNMDRVRSLNLSNSVAIAAYEAIRQIDYKELR